MNISMNLGLPMNWAWKTSVTNLVSDLLKVEDATESDRPKVAKIANVPKPNHDLGRPEMDTDRPKVTSIKVTKKNGGGQEDDFIYDFEFTVNMHGYAGDITIDLKYSTYETVSFTKANVRSTDTLILISHLSTYSLFGNLSTGEYTFNVDIIKGINVTLPRPIPAFTALTNFINQTNVPLGFGKKIINFFKRLFGNK